MTMCFLAEWKKKDKKMNEMKCSWKSNEGILSLYPCFAPHFKSRQAWGCQAPFRLPLQYMEKKLQMTRQRPGTRVVTGKSKMQLEQMVKWAFVFNVSFV